MLKMNNKNTLEILKFYFYTKLQFTMICYTRNKDIYIN